MPADHSMKSPLAGGCCIARPVEAWTLKHKIKEAPCHA